VIGVRIVSSGEDIAEDEDEVSEDADGDTVLLIESDVGERDDDANMDDDDDDDDDNDDDGAVSKGALCGCG
jgi:hypothetical protein